MAYLVDDTLLERITIYNNLNVAQTGITFTSGDVSGYYPDHTTIPFASITITELGNGVYEFSVVADEGAGFYSLNVEPPVANTNTYEIEWQVEQRSSGSVVTTSGGLSRGVLRGLILAKFGDLIKCTASANGTTTTFIDLTRLHLQPGMYRGREVIFTAGQASLIGLQRYVEASSRSMGMIEFTQALPVATATGDVIHMSNAYGVGVTIDVVNGAIDYVVTIAQDYAMVPISFDVVLPFDSYDAHRFVVPDNFVGVEQVLWSRTDGQWVDLQRANSGGHGGWFSEHGTRAISINGSQGRAIEGKMVRVTGYGLPTVPTVDADLVPLDTEWVVAEACAFICLDTLLSRQSSQDWGAKGMMYQQRADMLRPRLMPNIGPSFARW